tara:strand:- start:476 stop:679 length:204 start_codon:yes stop_codon:yes gene_type:complete
MNKKEHQLNFNSEEINLILKAMHKTYPILDNSPFAELKDKRKILTDIGNKLYNAKQKLNCNKFISLH